MGDQQPLADWGVGANGYSWHHRFPHRGGPCAVARNGAFSEFARRCWDEPKERVEWLGWVFKRRRAVRGQHPRWYCNACLAEWHTNNGGKVVPVDSDLGEVLLDGLLDAGLLDGRTWDGVPA